ncbi:hypothetical protein BYT27DRAFT_7251310 [Phlegmacium glaucopus]|nr:hypothetical protein BYT27DRAFT_7251310 [Phlegmacium glaucopus]
MSVDLGLRLSNTWRMKYETENTKSQEAKTSTTKLEQEIKQVSGRMAVLLEGRKNGVEIELKERLQRRKEGLRLKLEALEEPEDDPSQEVTNHGEEGEVEGSQQTEDSRSISKQQKITERYLAGRQMLTNRDIRDLGVLPEEAFEKYVSEKLERVGSLFYHLVDQPPPTGRYKCLEHFLKIASHLLESSFDGFLLALIKNFYELLDRSGRLVELFASFMELITLSCEICILFKRLLVHMRKFLQSLIHDTTFFDEL